jgi:hypothetical protein
VGDRERQIPSCQSNTTHYQEHVRNRFHESSPLFTLR